MITEKILQKISNPDFWIQPAWFQFAASIGAIGYAIYALGRNWKIARMVKSIDVAMHCALRYDALSGLRQTILQESGEKKEKMINYHNRYWAFVSDQFDYWIFGVLDHDTFFDLLCNLAARIIRERENGEAAEGEEGSNLDRLEVSWNLDHATSVKMRRVSNPQFEDFMGKLINLTKKHQGSDLSLLAKDILEHMKKMEKGFAKSWRKHVQSGLEFKYFHKAMLKDLEYPPFQEQVISSETKS